MGKDWSVSSMSCRRLFIFIAITFLALQGQPLFAAHKLAEEKCYDCHAVGGAKDMVVPNTNLIKKDAKVLEIINGGWTTGQPLPCAFCHDDATVRTNKVGIKNHFSDYSLSKHPVDPLTSNNTGTGGAVLDCIECHTNVAYVGGGANPLNPNIHSIDTIAVGWTGAGVLDATGTFKSQGSTILSPYNADGNILCTACHDSSYPTPLFTTDLYMHSYTTPGILSLEGSSFTTTVQGCLSTDGSPTGCHNIHHSAGNTSLITLEKSDGSDVGAGDCGICHTYDDPPSNRSSSDFYARGHGKFQATNDIECTSCHDPNDPHFNRDGTITGDRLSFFIDSTQNSNVSSPVKSLLSNCVSSNCHKDKSPHSGATYQVGCLDCHDPHGYEIGNNISMVRSVVPVAAPTGSLYYETTGAYFDSTFMGTSNYSNWLCDNEDCHSLGPGPIAVIMDTTNGTHSGGVGYMGGCESCHSHDNAGGSFGAADSCNLCHGQPPAANYGGNPDGFAVGYADTGHFKQEDKTPHTLHAGVSGYQYNGDKCKYCHLNFTDSDYHNTTISNPETFRNVVFDTAMNPNALAEGPNKYSPSYSISASTPNVCLNLYCHGDGQGIDRYNLTVVGDQAWDDTTSTTLTCEGCHGSNRTDTSGTVYFGAPDYPTGSGAAGDTTYNPGSGVTAVDTKANSHADTTKHGRYNCSVCHFATTNDTNPADGWTITDKAQHVDMQIDVAFDASVVTGTWNSTNKTCSSVWCHESATPQWGDTTSCTSCHNNGTNDGLLVNAAPVSGEHAAHIANTVYLGNCESCHGTGANTGTQVGHLNQAATFGSQLSSYITTDGTCANTCHTVVDGRDWTSVTTLDCVDCHGGAGTLDRNGFPPTTGAHPSHNADAGTADVSECVACHGDNGDNYGSSAGQHVDSTLDVLGTGVAYTASITSCTTTICHSPVPNSASWADTGYDWGGASSMTCDECHYWEAVPTAANNSADLNSLAGGHNAHFGTGGTVVCGDCHLLIIPAIDDTHIDGRAGADDAAVLTDMANASMNEAAITGTARGSYAETDGGVGNQTCDNTLCHDPSDASPAGTFEATWNTSSVSCSLCHADTAGDPQTGSHTQHIAASGTYGGTVACSNCHTVPSSMSHRDATVDFALAGTGYNGNPAAPFGTPYGTCTTSDCHNDGTGNRVVTSAWGTTITDPNCGICHASSPATVAHGSHLAHPAVDCTDCHDAASTTSMAGKTTHFDGDVTMANRASAYGGTTTVGDGGLYGSCDTGACHDAATDIAWNGTVNDCSDCHYNTLDVNSLNGQDNTASAVASGEWASWGHSAQGTGVVCQDCHSLSVSHDFSATLNSSGNPFRLDTGIFVSGLGCNTQGPCHTVSVANHSAEGITGSGGTTNHTWTFTPQCLNCHDPHGDGSNRFMISLEIWDEETGTFNPTGTPPAMPTEQLSLAYTDTISGITSTQSSYADYTGFDSICQECHTQTGSGNGFADDTAANYNGHPGWTGATSDNPGDCDACHTHDKGFAAGCTSCHDFPPTTGAHLAHASTANGKPEFNCEACHGPQPGSASWHNAAATTNYDPSNSTHYNEVTFNHNLSAIQRSTENAYFLTTWTRSGASVAPTVTRAGAYAFECTNVFCHGLDTVNWTWDSDATGNPANIEAYRTCGGCHGVMTDIDGDTNPDPDHDGDGLIDVASFRSRSGTLYQATSAAANYEGPVSEFSRGGHGDTLINDAQWFENTANTRVVALACVECHDSSQPHFPVAANDPYRFSDAVRTDTSGSQIAVTNLCITCHAEQASTFAFMKPPKHPSDHYEQWDASTSDTFVTDNSMALFSTFDPVVIGGIGVHIDQYADHFGYWGTQATTSASDDNRFLPLGDSLSKTTGGSFDNATNVKVTCITCHNPHGTDLYVSGKTPGSPDGEAQDRANKMLRLRDTDNELCGVCHQ